MADIHNTIELFEALKLVGIFGKKVMADGKVDLADLPLLIELAQKSAEFAKAIDGISEIPAEMKDIDMAEAEQLVAEIFKAIAEIKAA